MRHTPKHHQSHFDDPGRKMMISRLVPDLDPGLRPKFHYSSLLPGPEIEFAQSLCQGHDGTMVSPGIETGTGVPLSPVLKSSKASLHLWNLCKLSGRYFATHVCLWCAGPPRGKLQQRSAICTDNYLRSWKYVRKVQSERFLPISSGLLCWTSKEVQHVPCLFAFHVCL